MEELFDQIGDSFQYLTRSGHFTGEKLWFFEAHWLEKPIFGATPREVLEKVVKEKNLR